MVVADDLLFDGDLLLRLNLFLQRPQPRIFLRLHRRLDLIFDVSTRGMLGHLLPFVREGILLLAVGDVALMLRLLIVLVGALRLLLGTDFGAASRRQPGIQVVPAAADLRRRLLMVAGGQQFHGSPPKCICLRQVLEPCFFEFFYVLLQMPIEKFVCVRLRLVDALLAAAHYPE